MQQYHKNIDTHVINWSQENIQILGWILKHNEIWNL